MKASPFTIHVGDAALKDLYARIRDTRWPNVAIGSWDGGADAAYMRDLAEYWVDDFPWPAWQARLNGMRQFRADIDGLLIHFVHAHGNREAGQRPAILITHGWPGSFFEMYKLIPLLEDSFDVVVPSLPGFGFSDHPGVPGMGPERVAHLWKRLMDDLGYSHFAVQGGDFGAAVSTWLALHYPNAVSAMHLNYIPGSYVPYLGPGAPPLSEAEEQFQRDAAAWLEDEGGYWHLQATKPRTPAVALSDSPVGLAAWIVEKFVLWAGSPITRDEMLVNVMIYWITGTIGSSMRFYVETKARKLQFAAGQRVEVPCAIAHFPKEEPFPPREWIERAYKIRRWRSMPRGGHFAALEEPELLAGDIRAFLSASAT